MSVSFKQQAAAFMLRGQRKLQIKRRLQAGGESPKVSSSRPIDTADLKRLAAEAIIRDAEKKGLQVDPKDMPPGTVESWVEFDPVTKELKDYIADYNAGLTINNNSREQEKNDAINAQSGSGSGPVEDASKR